VPDASVCASWNRIDAWLEAHAPQVKGTLQPGVTDQQLAVCESKIGQSLPTDLKESFRIHDGQVDETEHGVMDVPPAGLMPFVGQSYLGEPSYELLPLARVVQDWEMLTGIDFGGRKSEPDLAIRNEWYHTGWIPIATNGGGDYFCIDLAPTANGTVGQVITITHDNPKRKLVAISFAAYLEQLAAGLEGGLIFLEEDGSSFVCKE
jgi:cell wall assembly regulator SMI1